MATPTAWLLNLDADEELADPARYRPDPRVQARIAALSRRMTLLLRPSDHVIAEDAPPAHARVLAFCPTGAAIERLRALGLTPPEAPSVEVLRAVNSRAFCASLGQTLPAAAYVHDMDELLATLRGGSPTGHFVLKRPFGFAGRERRLAQRGELDPSTRGFAARTFARGEGLQVEPWLERTRDVALHGYLTRDGALHVGPLVAQHCDRMGRWERSTLAAPDTLAPLHQEALHEELERTAEALRAAGYFGPFGLDAFTYVREDGGVGFQPRSEINARFTMGYPRELLERALGAEN